MVQKHIKKFAHNFKWDDTTILYQDSNYLNRGIRESIQIIRTKATLNKDGGWYKLPAIYKNLLQDRGESPTTPLPRSSLGDDTVRVFTA